MFKVVNKQVNKVNVNFVNEESDLNELALLKELKVFNAKAGEVFNALDLNNEGLIYVGINNLETNLLNSRMAGFNLGNLLKQRKINSVTLNTKDLSETNLEAVLEGLADSVYNFDFYKLNKQEQVLTNLSFNDDRLELINKHLNIMTGVFKARDLVNLTAQELYPESYSKMILDLFKDTDVSVEVMDKKAIEKLGMEALLQVAKGSNNEPRFVVLKYLPNKDQKEHTTIVGKGVTYDSGGYAIKSGGGMLTMKSDMAGSAAVVGLFNALALNKPSVNVVGVMALTENLIDGKAYKNGDVISTMKGLTVEVINTDAEGRLTLADAIYYAATKLNSKEILEASTLTGAAVAALGGNITAITTKNDDLFNKIHKIGNEVGEFNWRMPMTDDLIDRVKSDIAELKNAVPGGGGMMTAGIFLENFAEDVPFIHLDIAGPAYGNGYKHLPKGATGVLVKTFYKYVTNN